MKNVSSVLTQQPTIDSHYYDTHYLATVHFIDDNQFVIKGGMTEKIALRKAKKETRYCYVKCIDTQTGHKLTLVNNEWVRGS